MFRVDRTVLSGIPSPAWREHARGAVGGRAFRARQSETGSGPFPFAFFETDALAIAFPFGHAAAGDKGQSTFHLSCSDEDINGPEDCGKVAGDGKALAGYINQWIFEGMAGSGLVLDCTP